MKRKERLELEKQGYDLGFIARTQPQGNMKINNTSIELGDGEVCCLRVWRIPSSNLQYHWMQELEQFENTIVNWHVGTYDKEKFIKMLSKSMDEHSTRVKDGGRDRDNLNALNAKNAQMRFMNDLDSHGEVAKRIYARVYIYASDHQDLLKRKRAILGSINKFKAHVFVEEVDVDWGNKFVSATNQDRATKVRIPWHGVPMDARSLGAGYSFNHVNLDDPFGGYIGYSNTHGQMMFDPTYKNEFRTSPFMFTIGKTRYGKSTLAKTIIDYMFKRSAYLYNFDVASEYSTLTKSHHGLELTLDGTSNRINIFEIFPTVTNDDGTVDEINSFNNHLQKFRAITAELNSQINDDDLDLLEELLTDFYIAAGMWVRNAQKNVDDLHIIGLPHKQYPTLDFFVQFLMEQESSLGKARRGDSRKNKTMDAKSLHRLVRLFTKLQGNDIFNGYTTIPDFSTIHDVTFQLKGVKTQPKIMHALIINTLSLVSAYIVHRGEKYRKLYDAGQMAYEDIPQTWITWDEFQRSATYEFIEGVKWVSQFMQEMPKNFAGIHLIMPQIKDADPKELAGVPDAKFGQFRLEMSKIMGLMQYRNFFNLADSDIQRVADLMGESITDDELAEIPKLKRYEGLLNIAGSPGNMKYHLDPTSEQLKRYTGGA